MPARHSRTSGAHRCRTTHRITVAAAGVTAALATALGVTALATSVSGADPVTTQAGHTGNIVTVGDSFTANPDQVRNTLRGVPGPVGDWANSNYPATDGCLQGPNNWPNKLGALTGRAVDDYSCTALTSSTAVAKINAAIRDGKVRNDSTVVIAVGMNNYGGFGLIDHPNPTVLDIRGNYVRDVETMTRAIRAVAPDAKIILSGALPTVDRDTSVFCAVNVVPDAPAGVPVPPIRDIENHNRISQQIAAGKTGVTFIDMMDGATGHDTCAPDSQRYVAGIIDTTTPDYNMIFHPSDPGSAYIASTLAPAV